MVLYSDNYDVKKESKWLHYELKSIIDDSMDADSEDLNNKMLKKINAWQIGVRFFRVVLSVLASIPAGLGWIIIGLWAHFTKKNWFSAETVSDLKNELETKKLEDEFVLLEDEEEMGNQVQKEKEEEVVNGGKKVFEAKEANYKYRYAYSAMHAHVFCAEYEGEVVAAKFLPWKQRDDKKAIERLKQSAWLLQQVNSPNVAGYKAYVYDKDKGYSILMEHVDGTTLKSFLKECKEKGTQLTIDQKVKLATGYACGFKAIHQSYLEHGGIVHGDVKDANMMVITTKVVDQEAGFLRREKSHLEYFGKIVDPDSMHAVDELAADVSTFWTAPEIAKSIVESKKSKKTSFCNVENSTSHGTDIYGFGLLLWEILMLDALSFGTFKDNKGQDLPTVVRAGGAKGKILQGKSRILNLMGSQEKQYKHLRPIRPVIPETANQKLACLVRRCWNEDPKDRPKIDQVIEVLNGIK